MEHLTVELVLWILLVFFIGCIIGCVLRQALSRRRSETTVMPDEPVTEAADQAALAELRTLPEAPTVVVEEASELAALDALAEPADRSAFVPEPQEPTPTPKAAEFHAEPAPSRVPEPAPRSGDNRPRRPQGLAAPRRDRADNLQRISGIGPKLEKTLHDLGFFHYDQIAAWDPAEVTWINEHLRFRGRVEREQWIEQARLLAAGEEERFAQVYGVRVPRDGGEGEAMGGRRGQGRQ